MIFRALFMSPLNQSGQFASESRLPKNPFQETRKASGFLAVALLSLAVHAAIYLWLYSVPEKAGAAVKSELVTIKPIPPPPPPQPVVEKVKPPEPPIITPPAVKKPKARQDLTKKVLPKSVPQEIRGGVSNSTALKGTGSAGAPAVAEGNSSEVAVDPNAKGPAPALSSEESNEPFGPVVSENAVDEVAKCPKLPEVQITDEAANAGITSGVIILDVTISGEGKVVDAKIKKPLGYGLEAKAIEAAMKMKCSPGKIGGKSIGVIKRLEYTVEF